MVYSTLTSLENRANSKRWVVRQHQNRPKLTITKLHDYQYCMPNQGKKQAEFYLSDMFAFPCDMYRLTNKHVNSDNV